MLFSESENGEGVMEERGIIEERGEGMEWPTMRVG